MKRFGPFLGGVVGALAVLFLVSLFDRPSEATSLVIPNKTYSPGDIIRSSEWNANFNTIQSWSTNIDDTNLLNDGITASAKIKDGTIDLAAMGASSVNSSAIVDGTIVAADLSAAAIDTSAIVDGTIKEEDMAYLTAPTDGYYLRATATEPQWLAPECQLVSMMTNSNPAPGTTYWTMGGALMGGPSDHGAVVPEAATLSDFAGLAESVGGGGCSLEVEKNGAALGTPIFVTLSSADTVTTDSDTHDFAKNDRIRFKIIEIGTCDQVSISFCFRPTI